MNEQAKGLAKIIFDRMPVPFDTFRTPSERHFERALEAFAAIARMYRTAGIFSSQAVLEWRTDSHAETPNFLLPRLLVGCRDLKQHSITFIYSAETAARIRLYVNTPDAHYAVPDLIRWSSLFDAWCIDGHGAELDVESHTSLLESAFACHAPSKAR